MIKAVNLAQYGTSFRSEQPDIEQTDKKETRILPNNLKTKINQGTQKTMSAFVDYPVKGLKGDINSNFYEFLTMGIVPYLAGSAMFMVVFNCVNKYLDARGQKIASAKGKKLALGVIFYGILKGLSKNLVTKPVKAATGVDTEMPYQNVVYPLPKEAGAAADIEPLYQQRKVFDSKEFYRKDLLDRKYFDKVAKKLGLGENLNDSISETSPIIQNIVATTNTAKSLSSYCWAALGVGLAVQKPWDNFFDKISNRKRYYGKDFGKKFQNFKENSFEITKSFGKSFVDSCKSLWKGSSSNSSYMKHGGKALVGISAGLTALLTANTIIRAKNMAKNNNVKTIDKSKESTVI